MLWTGLGPIRRRHETRAARTNARFENQAFQNQQISVQGAKGQLILFLLKENHLTDGHRFRVTHINRGDHQVVDAPSDWFPIPAAVAASEQTGTRGSAIHLGRAAQVDRNTSGRQSGQVFVDRPSGGAPSDQHGRSGYDYDADHDSISSITPLGHTKHELAVFLSSWRSRLAGRCPMNPWQ